MLIPPPITSPADLCDATRWPTRVPPGYELVHGPEPRPAIPPPADNQAALVRFDLASTARRHRLACAAVLLGREPSAEEWSAISADFDARRRLSGDTDVRRAMVAASEAAESMGDGRVGAAVARLARLCGLPEEEWLTETRAEQAQRGSAR